MGWLQPYPLGLRIEAVLACQNQDWSALRRLARRWSSDAIRDLSSITKQQTTWNQLWEDVETFVRLARTRWNAPEDNVHWTAIRQQIAAALADSGLSASQIEQAFDQYSRATIDDVAQALQVPLNLISEQIDASTRGRHSALSATDLALAVSMFNVVGVTPHKPRPGAALAATQRADKFLRELFQKLKSGTRVKVVRTAQAAEQWAGRAVASLALDAGHYARTMQRPSEVSRKALEIAEAIRIVMFLEAASRKVAWVAGWHDGSRRIEQFREAANNKTFESAYRAPDVIDLDDVLQSQQAYDGRDIAIEGTVGPVAIIHRHTKVVSSTSLTTASGAVLRVGLPHIKIDSGGLVPGSYARVAGRFSLTHADFRGPVLVPHRRNLTGDAQSSWLDWLTLQLLPIVTIPAHHVTAVWTWELGADGPANPLRYGTWSDSSRRRAI
ncbi:MAG TPA: hypothetical protein VIV40_24370 [Kofleriaceae bacterium]